MTNEFSKTEPIYIHQRIINDNAREMFCQKLHKTDWAEIETPMNPNVCYKIFLEKLMSLYYEGFPIKIIKLKTKDIQSPWITTGIKKLSSWKLDSRKRKMHTKVIKIYLSRSKNLQKSFILLT